MSSFIQRLGSRKFLLAFGAVVGFVLLGITGQMDMTEAVENAKVIVLGYLAAEGAPDIMERFQQGRVDVVKEETKQLEFLAEEEEK